MLNCSPLNQGALRGAQRGLGADHCFRWLPRVGCQQEDLRARRDLCFSLYVAWVCLPLGIFLRQLWKGQPRPWQHWLRQLRPGSWDKDLPGLHDYSNYVVLHAALHILYIVYVYLSSMFMIFSCLWACVNFEIVIWYFCFFKTIVLMFFPCRRTRKLNAELANGRLAMMAIIGMLLSLCFESFLNDFDCFVSLCLRWLWADVTDIFWPEHTQTLWDALRRSATLRFFQDGLTGSAWGDWALYTDSPLRSGVKSPGYNTLPEWEKPKTGCSLRFVSELLS